MIDLVRWFKLVRRILDNEISTEWYSKFEDRIRYFMKEYTNQLNETEFLHSIVVFMDEVVQYQNDINFPVEAVDFILEKGLKKFELDGILKLWYSLSYLHTKVICKLDAKIFKLMSELLLELKDYRRLAEYSHIKDIKKWLVDTQIWYRGIYQAHSLFPEVNILNCMQKHEKGLLKYLTQTKNFKDLETHTNLLSSITMNHYISSEKYSTLPHNLAVLYLLFKAIVTLGKDEVFVSSNKNIFLTIYAFKRLLMHLKKMYPDSTQPELVKFEKQLKVGFKLFTNVLLQNRFESLSESDKIRILFEAVNLRVLKEDDIRNHEVMSFIKSLAQARKIMTLDSLISSKSGSLKPLDFFNISSVLSSSIVFSVLWESYGKSNDEAKLKLAQPSKQLIEFYSMIMDSVDMTVVSTKLNSWEKIFT